MVDMKKIKLLSFFRITRSSYAFTLIELLITISILSVLATALVLVINPAELIKKSRDATRLSDLGIIERAIGLIETDNPSASLGNGNTVYISLPDTSVTCANLSLPLLPSGWGYSCVNESSIRNVDGTGWIPVDFTQFSAGSTLSVLPIDPVNNLDNGYYYTFVTGGSWKLTGIFESKKFSEDMKKDGGPDPSLYELGDDLILANFARGLAGYWSMDGNYLDSSGNNNNGAPFGGVTFSSGKLNQAGSFDGVDDYIKTSSGPSLNIAKEITLSAWINTTTLSGHDIILSRGNPYISRNGDDAFFRIHINGTGRSLRGTTRLKTNTWYYIVATFDGTLLKIYLDGELENSVSFPGPITCCTNNPYDIGRNRNNNNYAFPGVIDEVRVYNRALSGLEVKSIYNATK
jgi:prepilin-type N-terminal cleavage/methylation domain-containing protein